LALEAASHASSNIFHVMTFHPEDHCTFEGHEGDECYYYNSESEVEGSKKSRIPQFVRGSEGAWLFPGL